MTLIAATGRRRYGHPTLGDYYTIGTSRRLNLTAGTVNLVVDGNSIMTSAFSAVGAFDASLRLLDPLASTVDTSTSVAISGQTWTDMAANHADLDAAWVDGATNILYIGETRNQIVVDYETNGITNYETLVARCKAAIEEFLTSVRAVHPGWAVIIGGTLPSGGSTAARYVVENAAFVEVDQWIYENVDTLSIYAFVGFRNHPAFDHDGTAPEPFQAYPSFWQETSVRWTHPKDPGKEIMAQNVNNVVQMMST